jgi:hypothetical protein
MSSAENLHAFAYGEDLDGLSQRSLGYRLLAPAAPAPWSGEVLALARLLQATPYPEHWPAADLFCSILLSTGERLIAVARYGLADHTPSKRRGGLELVGVVGPRSLDPATALKVYEWLRRRRAATADLRQLGEQHTLAKILAESPAVSTAEQPAMLPVRAWQTGALLFQASAAQAPDKALGLLSQATTADWQWLPLCGPDFPLDSYAQRGPLVAWTPQLIEVGVRLGAPPAARPAPAPLYRWAVLGAAGLLALLLVGNLWALWSLPSRLDHRPPPEAEMHKEPSRHVAPSAQAAAENESREKLALGLYRLLEPGCVELAQAEAQLISRYERLAVRDEALRVDSKKGRAALGLVSVLAGRSADRVAQLIEEEFKDKKGYDPGLIRLISQRVRERLLAEVGKSPP